MSQALDSDSACTPCDNDINTNPRLREPEVGGFDYFESFDGAEIRYGYWPVEQAKGTVVILGGRTEFIEKYFEDMHEWQKRGYSVAAMDWRGQGLSHRLCAGMGDDGWERHYLTSFDDLLLDLRIFFDRVAEREGMTAPFMLMGHSQGSHSCLRFMHDYPDMIDRAILVAPMVDIPLPGPDFLVLGLAKFMRLIGQAHRYVPGHQAFKTGRWGWRKKLTHDEDRFCDEDWFIHNKDRRLAVGGVTYGWLLAAKASIQKLNGVGYAEKIKTPILMVQAGEDQIVDNKRQSALAHRMKNTDFLRIEEAKHEILKEIDSVRNQVWNAIDSFLKK